MAKYDVDPDATYLKLIKKNQDGENLDQIVCEASSSTSASKSSNEHEEPKADQVKFLKEYEARKQVIESMENALKSFPYCRYTQYSEGIESRRSCIFCGARAAHYSDSCPTVRNSLDREQVTFTLKPCKLCLESYEEGRCTKLPWYCTKVEPTAFEDLTPRDDGHYRALCPVPDAKWRMEARLEAAIIDLR